MIYNRYPIQVATYAIQSPIHLNFDIPYYNIPYRHEMPFIKSSTVCVTDLHCLWHTIHSASFHTMFLLLTYTLNSDYSLLLIFFQINQFFKLSGYYKRKESSHIYLCGWGTVLAVVCFPAVSMSCPREMVLHQRSL